jgi:hypothetical protein
MIKLQIVDGSLQVSNNGTVILVAPKNSCAIDVLSLYDTIPLVVIYNKYLGTSTNIFTQPLANCVDSVNVPFSVNTFIDFAEANFGFDTTGGGCGGCNSPFKYNANLSGIEPIIGSNNASGTLSTIGGGSTNTASGVYSTIGGGVSNSIGANSLYSVVSGGQCNVQDYSNHSVINGGVSNAIGGGGCAFIGGGQTNQMYGTSNWSFIGGGQYHINQGDHNFIGAGYCNKIYDTVNQSAISTIVGGIQNTICESRCSFIGGGGSNIICNGNSANFYNLNNSILGGYNNKIGNNPAYCCVFNSYNVISGGCENIICSNENRVRNNFIGGGRSNQICSNVNSTTCQSIIVGGFNNRLYNEFNVIVGGYGNKNYSLCSFIGGGKYNYINRNGESHAIVGGKCNKICTGNSYNYNFIGGGCCNYISSNSCYSSIIGGVCNRTCGCSNVHIIGCNICANANDYTFMNNLKVCGNVNITGSISKGSGSFSISHPNPSKNKTHKLIHSFVESPTAGDNIYRYEVEVINGIATIKLPDYYEYLNENTQIWVTPKNGFGIAYGVVAEDLKTATIYADKDLIYNVLIIGTRKDKLAKEYWKGAELEIV